MMSLLKKIPFFLLLLPLFFCLHGAVENCGFISFKDVLYPGIIITASVLTLAGIIFLFSRSFILAALIMVFIACWYLFFGALHDLIKATSFLSFLQSYSVLLPVLGLLTLLWIFFVVRKKVLHQRLVLYLNILLLIYCCIDGFTIVKSCFQKTGTAVTGTVAFDVAKVVKNPNVYLIVLDEYPGSRSLLDSFGFSNSRFQYYLTGNSFRILPVFSNYDLTYFSMSSMLNMQYIKDDFDNLHLSQGDFQRRGVEINQAAVFRNFKAMGYKLENYSIFDVDGQPAISSENDFLLAHSILLTDKILHNRMKRDIGDRLGKVIPFWKYSDFYYHDVDNKKTEDMLRKSAAEKSQRPKFVYSHFMMPHGPYYYDSLGNKNPYEKISHYSKWKDKELFISYLKYINKRMENLLTGIIRNDPAAIIILMGDHGFREYEDDRLYQPLRYDNLCAVRFPDNRYKFIGERLSNVNLFRYLFNCEFGQNIPYLKDSSVLLRY